MKIREDYLKARPLFTHLETEMHKFDATLEVKFQMTTLMPQETSLCGGI